MHWELILSTFGLIFIAELPDKTAITTVMLATQMRTMPVFVGVALAFVVQSLIGVLAGDLIAHLPQIWVHAAVAVVFFIFAYLALRPQKTEEIADYNQDVKVEKNAVADTRFFPMMMKSFVVIFLAEWGDLTQLATASIEAVEHRPVEIFLASVAALWSVTAIAVLVGRKLRDRIDLVILNRLAGLSFVAAGIYFTIAAIRN